MKLETVEITDARVSAEKIVTIEGIDVSDEHLQYLERMRDDGGFERDLRFCFDTNEKKPCADLVKFLRRQVATTGCETYGEALRAIVGTRTTLPSRYLVWE